jgi:hypothetical protein
VSGTLHRNSSDANTSKGIMPHAARKS